MHAPFVFWLFMYEKTDRLCPKCFRRLLSNRHDNVFYCPDTLHCQLKRSMKSPPPRVTIDELNEALAIEYAKPRSFQNSQMIQRIKDAFERLN